MKKKILGVGIIVILIVLLVTLTGCANNENEENKEVKENSKLSEIAKVGDYVDYKVIENNKYSSPKEKTGYNQDQTFITNGKEKWRVLDINENGSVTLVSAEPIQTSNDNTYYLMQKEGYENGVTELDNIAQIYANGNKAISARNLKREDINKLIGLDNFAKFYNLNLDEYTTDDEKWEAIYKKINENYGEKISANSASEVVNNYEVKLSDLVEDNELFQSLLNGRYWLANQTIDYYSGSSIQGNYQYFNYGISYVSSSSSSKNKFTLDSAYTSVTLLASDNFSVGNDMTKFNRDVRPIVILSEDTICNGGTGRLTEPFSIE